MRTKPVGACADAEKAFRPLLSVLVTKPELIKKNRDRRFPNLGIIIGVEHGGEADQHFVHFVHMRPSWFDFSSTHFAHIRLASTAMRRPLLRSHTSSFSF